MNYRWMVYCSLALAHLLVPAPAISMVQVGQEAPDFTLTDPDSQSYTLSAYRGQVVVLCFIGYG